MKHFISTSSRDEKISYLGDLDIDIKSVRRSIKSFKESPLMIFETHSCRVHKLDIFNRILKRLIERYNRVLNSLKIQEHTYSLYECDNCGNVEPLNQESIREKEFYVEPHGCFGGDYQKHDYYFFDCSCGRPVEVNRKDIASSIIPPVADVSHGRGRCIKNVKR